MRGSSVRAKSSDRLAGPTTSERRRSCRKEAGRGPAPSPQCPDSEIRQYWARLSKISSGGLAPIETEGHYRVFWDRIDKAGKVTLRYHSRSCTLASAGHMLGEQVTLPIAGDSSLRLLPDVLPA